MLEIIKMVIPNKNQLTSFVRWVISVGAAYAVGKGVIPPDYVPKIMEWAPVIVTLIWSLMAHSQDGTIAATAAIPEVAGVIVTPKIANSPAFIYDSKVVSQPSDITPIRDGEAR